MVEFIITTLSGDRICTVSAKSKDCISSRLHVGIGLAGEKVLIQYDPEKHNIVNDPFTFDVTDEATLYECLYDSSTVPRMCVLHNTVTLSVDGSFVQDAYDNYYGSGRGKHVTTAAGIDSTEASGSHIQDWNILAPNCTLSNCNLEGDLSVCCTDLNQISCRTCVRNKLGLDSSASNYLSAPAPISLIRAAGNFSVSKIHFKDLSNYYNADAMNITLIEYIETKSDSDSGTAFEFEVSGCTFTNIKGYDHIIKVSPSHEIMGDVITKITNSYFNGNTSYRPGVAIFHDSVNTLQITDSSFINNIYHTPPDQHNDSDQDACQWLRYLGGGAIYTKSLTIRLEGSGVKFSNNESDTAGGAIYIDGYSCEGVPSGTHIVIGGPDDDENDDAARFSDNRAIHRGGAIYSTNYISTVGWGASDAGIRLLGILHFTGNSANMGGAIYTAGIKIDGKTYFNDNFTITNKGGQSPHGGAIASITENFLQDVSGDKLNNVTFKNNYTALSGNGGALYHQSNAHAHRLPEHEDAVIVLDSCHFKSNYNISGDGGAIYIAGPDLGIYPNKGYSTFRQVRVKQLMGNAKFEYNGVSGEPSDTTTCTEVSNNILTLNGGAISSNEYFILRGLEGDSQTVEEEGFVFNYNRCRQQGGGVHFSQEHTSWAVQMGGLIEFKSNTAGVDVDETFNNINRGNDVYSNNGVLIQPNDVPDLNGETISTTSLTFPTENCMRESCYPTDASCLYAFISVMPAETAIPKGTIQNDSRQSVTLSGCIANDLDSDPNTNNMCNLPRFGYVHTFVPAGLGTINNLTGDDLNIIFKGVSGDYTHGEPVYLEFASLVTLRPQRHHDSKDEYGIDYVTATAVVSGGFLTGLKNTVSSSGFIGYRLTDVFEVKPSEDRTLLSPARVLVNEINAINGTYYTDGSMELIAIGASPKANGATVDISVNEDDNQAIITATITPEQRLTMGDGFRVGDLFLVDGGSQNGIIKVSSIGPDRI